MKTKITTLIALFFLGSKAVFGQWTDLLPGTIDGNYIDCVDGHTCYIAGLNGTVKKTLDGGQTWIDVSLPFADHISTIKCFDANTVYVDGEQSFYKTTDGGQNWVDVPILLYSPYFINTQTGFATYSNDLYKTTDAGSNWSQIILSNVLGSYGRLHFLNEMIGFMTTTQGSPTTIRIYKTIDGGQTWTKVFENTDFAFLTIKMIDENTGYACGTDGEIYKTTDIGSTWTRVINPLSETAQIFQDLDFIDENNGYVVGGQNKILKTTDGGQTWMDESYPTANHYFYGVRIMDNDTVYISSETNLVLKNTNAGFTVKVNILDKDFGNVYPNPFKDELIIDVKQGSTNTLVTFYSISGKKVYETELSSDKNSIQLDFLESGFYTYQISTKNEIVSSGTIIKN